MLFGSVCEAKTKQNGAFISGVKMTATETNFSDTDTVKDNKPHCSFRLKPLPLIFW